MVCLVSSLCHLCRDGLSGLAHGSISWRVCELAAQLRSALHAAGLDTLASASPIVPVVLGGAADALAVSRSLLDAGFLVPAIRPPTVARGTSRLRISLCAGHEDEDVAALAEHLAQPPTRRPDHA